LQGNTRKLQKSWDKIVVSTWKYIGELMRLTAHILSEAEKERLHGQSLRLLEQVGVRFHSDKALHLLEENGARVDWDEKIAHIPGDLVDQALSTAPKSFVLGARNPTYNLTLPSPVSYYCTDGTAAFAIDFHSGERRYGTRKDNENGMRVFQEMDLGMMAWAPTTASDAPSTTRALHEFFTMIRYCSKHGQHELHSVEQVPYLVEGLCAIQGDEETLKSRLDYSLIYCPVAPLSHEQPMLDAYLELGQWNLPVMTMPMPVSGSTGPASLFSTLCLANAENLSSIVIFQLAHPGRPIVYNNATGVMDFFSGAYLGGVPEMGLMSAGLIEMGRFYGLPTGSAGCTADAKEPGPQAVLEKLITTLPPVLLGADIIAGTGEIESDQALVLEQLVVDNEIGHFCQRVVEGIDSNPEKDLFDDIVQVGPGGHFLKSKKTRQAARSGEFYMSRLLPRGATEAWIEAGRPDIYRRARQIVSEILESPVKDPLPGNVTGRIDEILERADRELAV
jgi:trimethylamine--corrinoid protein Co-methyltransferase